MAPADQEKEKRQKIQTLEKELADLRQGLCLIQDYDNDLEKVKDKQDAEENVDQSLLKPLMREEEEFEGIWKFYNEMLTPDPSSQVPYMQMYEAFVTYCTRKGRDAVERPAFEFLLLKMGVQQRPERNVWQGYRIRTDRT
jgi:vacuolar-type H+-ATPase subunit I/STV1